METKILYVNREHYIITYLGFDDYREMQDFSNDFLRSMHDSGEFCVNLKENFESRDVVAIHLLEIDEDFEYELEDEFYCDVPLEFEYKGVNYVLKLEGEE